MSTEAVARRPETLKQILEKPEVKNRLREVIGENSGQFGAALIQIQRNSYGLSKCQPESILGSALMAAALDLSVDPNIGEAHLVPYGDKCQLQIGYPGFIQLGQRSGQYRNLGWKIVYEGEFVSYDELTGELALDPKGKKNETIIGYAAKFKLLNGFEHASYWTVQRVKAHAERYSQAYKKKKMDSPWYTNFDKMALKTVIKDLVKTWGPKSIKMQRALAVDQAVFKDMTSEPEYSDAIDVSSETVAAGPSIPGPKLTPKAPVGAPGTAPEASGEPETSNLPSEAPEGATEPKNASAEGQNTPSDDAIEGAMGLGPAPETHPDPKFAPKQGDSENLAQVKLLAAKSGVTYAQLMAFLTKSGFAKDGQQLTDLAEAKLANLIKGWMSVQAKAKGM